MRVGGPPGRARRHRGCTGWALSLRSRGTIAAPQSRRLSQSHWCPAGRGRALESQHTAVPPRIPHPEETGRKEVVRAECGHTQPGTCLFTKLGSGLSTKTQVCQITGKCKDLPQSLKLLSLLEDKGGPAAQGPSASFLSLCTPTHPSKPCPHRRSFFLPGLLH